MASFLGHFTDTTPKITWTHNDPELDAQVGYQVQIDSSPEFISDGGSPEYDSGDVTSGVSEDQVSPALTNGIKYVRVRTRDAGHVITEGAFSDLGFFTINSTIPLLANGDTTPQYQFDSGIDPENDNIHFELQVDSDPLFPSPFLDRDTEVSQTGWTYDSDGLGTFLAFPAGGLPAAVQGNEVRHDTQAGDELDAGFDVYYWFRVRGRDTPADDVSDYAYSIFFLTAGTLSFIDATQDIRTRKPQLDDITQDIRFIKDNVDTDITQDIRFLGSFSILRDVIQDIRNRLTVFADATQDIRFVDEIEVLRDLRQDIRFFQEVIEDVTFDIRTDRGKLVDLIQDIRFVTAQFDDVTQDIRTQGPILADVVQDIRFSNGQFDDATQDIRFLAPLILDFDQDIRFKGNTLDDAAQDIRFKTQAVPTSAGLDALRVKIAGVFIEDVDRSTLEWNWTANEEVATATFRIARRPDDFNRTIAGAASPIADGDVVEIFYNDILKYSGFVRRLQGVSLNAESVTVYAEDARFKIQNELQDFAYGFDTVRPTLDDALSALLADIVTAGHITSFTGVPNLPIVLEPVELQGIPQGQLLTQILDEGGNFQWTVTPEKVLEIYELGTGTLVNLPLKQTGRQTDLFDVVDFSFGRLNDTTDLTTEAEVVLGTRSAREFSSFREVSLFDKQLIPAWTGPANPTSGVLNRIFGVFNDPQRQILNLGITGGTRDNDVRDVLRAFKIPGWEEGSVLADSSSLSVLTDVWAYTVSYGAGTQLTKRGLNKPWPYPWKERGWEFDSRCGVIRFARPMAIIIDADLENGYMTNIRGVKLLKPRVDVRYFQKSTIALDTNPTIFDVPFVGNGGAGAKRRVVLSSLGIREQFTFREFVDGNLQSFREHGFDDTEFAEDVAKLMLSRLNDPKTDGAVSVIFDAQDFYGLDLSKRINLDNTLDASGNVFKDNSGFPLNVTRINFSGGSLLATLQVENFRAFRRSKNFSRTNDTDRPQFECS